MRQNLPPNFGLEIWAGEVPCLESKTPDICHFQNIMMLYNKISWSTEKLFSVWRGVKLYQVYGQAEKDWEMADNHENVLYSKSVKRTGKEQYCAWALQSPVI